MKATAIALLLAASMSADAAEGFRPWGNPGSDAAQATRTRPSATSTHELGFQPFIETQRRVMDTNVVLDPRHAEMFRQGFGFQPRNVRS